MGDSCFSLFKNVFILELYLHNCDKVVFSYSNKALILFPVQQRAKWLVIMLTLVGLLNEALVLHHWQPVNLQLSALLPTTFVAAGTTIKCDIVTEAL